MTIVSSTKVESSSLSTSAVKVWATPTDSRYGIMVHASSANTGNLLITTVDKNAAAPTLTAATAQIELFPGQSFEGDYRYNSTKDIYVAMTSGTGAYNAYEVINL